MASGGNNGHLTRNDDRGSVSRARLESTDVLFEEGDRGHGFRVSFGVCETLIVVG